MLILSITLLLGSGLDVLFSGFGTANITCLACGLLIGFLALLARTQKAKALAKNKLFFPLVAVLLLIAAAGILKAAPVSSDSTQVLRKAEKLMESGKQAEAYTLIQQHLEDNPGTPEVINQLGLLYQAHGSLIEAKNAFQKAWSAAPSFRAAGLNLCKLCLQTEDYKTVINIGSTLLKQWPKDPEISFLLSEAYYAGRDTIRGSYYGKIAAENTPDSWRMHLKMGNNYAAQLDYELARYEYDMAQKLAVNFNDYLEVIAAQERLSELISR